MHKILSRDTEMEGQKNEISPSGMERRSEERSIVELYSSVEFSLKKLDYTYQFKIWETSNSGMSILVSDGSVILEHLEIGDVLDMKYYPSNSSDEPVIMKTEIRHITRDVQERIKGHCLIGLSIIDKEVIH